MSTSTSSQITLYSIELHRLHPPKTPIVEPQHAPRTLNLCGCSTSGSNAHTHCVRGHTNHPEQIDGPIQGYGAVSRYLTYFKLVVTEHFQATNKPGRWHIQVSKCLTYSFGLECSLKDDLPYLQGIHRGSLGNGISRCSIYLYWNRKWPNYRRQYECLTLWSGWEQCRSHS